MSSRPYVAVDIIIEMPNNGIVLIERKNEPHGYALVGGHCEYGESLESAAIREAKEETGLDITLVRQFGTYSDPSRDPRRHTASTIFIAKASGTPVAADDAKEVGIYFLDTLPEPLCFDHAEILQAYFRARSCDNIGSRAADIYRYQLELTVSALYEIMDAAQDGPVDGKDLFPDAWARWKDILNSSRNVLNGEKL